MAFLYSQCCCGFQCRPTGCFHVYNPYTGVGIEGARINEANTISEVVKAWPSGGLKGSAGQGPFVSPINAGQCAGTYQFQTNSQGIVCKPLLCSGVVNSSVNFYTPISSGALCQGLTPPLYNSLGNLSWNPIDSQSNAFYQGWASAAKSCTENLPNGTLSTTDWQTVTYPQCQQGVCGEGTKYPTYIEIPYCLTTFTVNVNSNAMPQNLRNQISWQLHAFEANDCHYQNTRFVKSGGSGLQYNFCDVALPSYNLTASSVAPTRQDTILRVNGFAIVNGTTGYYIRCSSQALNLCGHNDVNLTVLSTTGSNLKTCQCSQPNCTSWYGSFGEVPSTLTITLGTSPIYGTHTGQTYTATLIGSSASGFGTVDYTYSVCISTPNGRSAYHVSRKCSCTLAPFTFCGCVSDTCKSAKIVITLTQQVTANTYSISSMTYSSYFNNSCNPSISACCAIAVTAGGFHCDRSDTTGNPAVCCFGNCFQGCTLDYGVFTGYSSNVFSGSALCPSCIDQSLSGCNDSTKNVTGTTTKSAVSSSVDICAPLIHAVLTDGSIVTL